MPNAQTVVINANTLWQNTEIAITVGVTVTIEVMGGEWTANPATGMVNADGNPKYIAKPGYNLEGFFEGLLVGRIGQGTVYPIGSLKTTFKAPISGNLFLSINDDMKGIYGAGFTDNRGAITVSVTVG